MSRLAGNVLQLPVVGVLEHSTVLTENVYIKIQNFLLPRPRQLLVGVVSSMCAAPSMFSGVCEELSVVFEILKQIYSVI